MPKGTLWRQADIFDAAIGSFALVTGLNHASLESAADTAPTATASRLMATPPFMHGAAGWSSLGCLLAAGTLVIQSEVTKLDAADVLSTVEREGVQTIVIVGDAFARPICDELAKGVHDVSSLVALTSGGAILSPSMKERIFDLLPNLIVLDIGGSSETGSQMSAANMKGQNADLGIFAPTDLTCVVDADKKVKVAPGHQEDGWLAKRGAIPLGYLGDQAKTEATFPVVEGERMSIPGDRARLREDGMIVLLGRESMTINSGGEKIFAEEVEQALVAHPDVDDVLVVGRPSERWGNEVVAVVQLRPGADPSDEDLIAVASAQVARYKLPKDIIRVALVQRSPSGKADYAWAKKRAAETA
jgi:fatty-acyl-CoA synthase